MTSTKIRHILLRSLFGDGVERGIEIIYTISIRDWYYRKDLEWVSVSDSPLDAPGPGLTNNGIRCIPAIPTPVIPIYTYNFIPRLPQPVARILKSTCYTVTTVKIRPRRLYALYIYIYKYLLFACET